MSLDLARVLFETGRSHAMAAHFLHQSALRDATDSGLEDPEHFAFNGIYSLSQNYLLGLGLELLIKAAIVGWGGPADDRSLRRIGHDLIAGLDMAEAAGFHSAAPNLRGLLTVMNEPYMAHWFRYERPAQIALPGNMAQVVETLAVLDAELQARLWVNEGDCAGG